jgi:hypothetical protein
MFNINVGDMPLDIFSDYISDILGQEWSWEYLNVALNWAPENSEGILFFEKGNSNADLPDYYYGAGDGYLIYTFTGFMATGRGIFFPFFIGGSENLYPGNGNGN